MTRRVSGRTLSTQAREIIRTLPRDEAGPFLFSSDGGKTPVSGFSKAKARLDRHLAKMSDDAMASWVVHDLRRSMATPMERISIEPHVIEVCLGHVLKGVAGTYRHYGYLPEKTAALQKWADELLRNVSKAAPSAHEAGRVVTDPERNQTGDRCNTPARVDKAFGGMG